MSSPPDYRPMWAELGLDLAQHDALLGVLGQAYTELFVNRPGRPAGMGYFDFVMSEVHGLRIKELLDAKAAGRIVIGSFCVFVPEEFVLAVDGVSVGLCAGAEFGLQKAEEYLPRNTCSLIKSFFGFTLERVCPYIAACDLVVGENTCDGKKKAYEAFGKLVRRLYVMDMPQTKGPSGWQLFHSEYQRLLAEFEAVSGRKVTADKLRGAIHTVNAKRAALHRLARLRAADPAPIAGLDALLVNQVAFYDDPPRFTGAVEKICDELEQRIAARQGAMPAGSPRILVSGCPMAVPNWKLPAIIEAAGAVMVGEESCVGERGTQNLVREQGSTVDELLEGIARRYFAIDCAIFTPNPERLAHVKSMAREYHAQGVIHYALQFCAPYQIEAGQIERDLEAAGLPALRIDTDYSQEDCEQIRTRVEAFVERLRT